MMTETPDKTKRGYSGAGWLEHSLSLYKPSQVLSEFGREVANLLGDLYGGIYHMDDGALGRADWSNNRRISVTVSDHGQFGTYDFGMMTGLVFLAHEYGIKATIEAASPRHLRLTFYKPGQAFSPTTHPTLQEALERYEKGKVK